MSDVDTIDLSNLQNLIDSYNVQDTGAPKQPTLMEIADFPHWENVYSNILAFFLNTKEAHGFGELFLHSILEAYLDNCPTDWRADDRFLEDVETTERVEREVITKNNKRIDLLVECADFLICIENKISSGLHNDLGEYRDYCNGIGSERRVLGIVLSPNGVTSPNIQAHRFVNITYTELVKYVRQRIGNHVGPYNTQYQYLLLDFLDQASRLARTTTMNNDHRAFLDFWQKNNKKISNIQLMCDNISRELDAKAKAEDHINQCKERLDQFEQEVFKAWVYNRSVSVFDLAGGGSINGCGIFLDVEFHPLRVTHRLGKRRGQKPNELASQISNISDIIIFDNSCDRPVIVTEESPFEASVRERSVETSVAILKAIAFMRLKDPEGALSD